MIHAERMIRRFVGISLRSARGRTALSSTDADGPRPGLGGSYARAFRRSATRPPPLSSRPPALADALRPRAA